VRKPRKILCHKSMRKFSPGPPPFFSLIAVTGLLIMLLCSCSEPPRDCFQGYVEGEFVHVSTSLAGQLQSLPVKRGINVRQGDPLFTLEHAFEAEALAEAEQNLRRAENKLADLSKGLRPSELAAIEARLAQARSAHNLARLEYNRREKLFADHTIAKEQLDRARTDMDSNSAAVAQLTAELKTARLGARADEVEAARADMEAARSRLSQARWRLDQKTQTAPQTAYVYDTLYNEGEYIPAGYPVVSLLPPGNIKVRFFVPEQLVGSLSFGRRGTVSFDGAAEKYPIRVSHVSPQAEYTPPVIYSRETRSKLVFMIEAEFTTDRAAGLHPGQPVDVFLE
jgi:HlyD family secretion protein